MPFDLPPPSPPAITREACIASAASRYAVPVDLVRAVIRTEGGKTGAISGNKNGSYDMGLMQVNSIHLPEMKRYGITRDYLINNECINIHIGTFILHRALSESQDFWRGVGAYNSKTPVHNERYRKKVWGNLVKLWQGK